MIIHRGVCNFVISQETYHFCMDEGLNGPFINSHNPTNSLLARQCSPREATLFNHCQKESAPPPLDDFALFQTIAPVGKFAGIPSCWLPACGLRSGFCCR